MGAAPTVAVQVVNYRTRPYLEKCLETVVADLDGGNLDYEINLLDNASGESLDDLAHAIPACRAYMAPSNLGFGAGHNLLAAKTAAPYLLILNPDVELVAPDTINRLLAALRGDERLGHLRDRDRRLPAGRAMAAGPKLITEAGEPQRWDHGRLHGIRAQISLRAGHSYWRPANARLDVAWVSGAALIVEHAAFAGVGGFDENLFLYKEDEDLCLRLRRAGGRVLYEPTIVVRHHGTVVSDRPDEVARASRYFFAKHFPNRRARRAFSIAHHWLARLNL